MSTNFHSVLFDDKQDHVARDWPQNLLKSAETKIAVHDYVGALQDYDGAWKGNHDPIQREMTQRKIVELFQNADAFAQAATPEHIVQAAEIIGHVVSVRADSINEAARDRYNSDKVYEGKHGKDLNAYYVDALQAASDLAAKCEDTQPTVAAGLYKLVSHDTFKDRYGSRAPGAYAISHPQIRAITKHANERLLTVAGAQAEAHPDMAYDIYSQVSEHYQPKANMDGRMPGWSEFLADIAPKLDAGRLKLADVYEQRGNMTYAEAIRQGVKDIQASRKQISVWLEQVEAAWKDAMPKMNGNADEARALALKALEPEFTVLRQKRYMGFTDEQVKATVDYVGNMVNPLVSHGIDTFKDSGFSPKALAIAEAAVEELHDPRKSLDTDKRNRFKEVLAEKIREQGKPRGSLIPTIGTIFPGNFEKGRQKDHAAYLQLQADYGAQGLLAEALKDAEIHNTQLTFPIKLLMSMSGYDGGTEHGLDHPVYTEPAEKNVPRIMGFERSEHAGQGQIFDPRAQYKALSEGRGILPFRNHDYRTEGEIRTQRDKLEDTVRRSPPGFANEVTRPLVKLMDSYLTRYKVTEDSWTRKPDPVEEAKFVQATAEGLEDAFGKIIDRARVGGQASDAKIFDAVVTSAQTAAKFLLDTRGDMLDNDRFAMLADYTLKSPQELAAEQKIEMGKGRRKA